MKSKLDGKGKKRELVLGNAGNFLAVGDNGLMTDEMKELLVLAEEACELAPDAQVVSNGTDEVMTARGFCRMDLF